MDLQFIALGPSRSCRADKLTVHYSFMGTSAGDPAQARHSSQLLADEPKGLLWTRLGPAVAPIRIRLGEGAVERCVG